MSNKMIRCWEQIIIFEYNNIPAVVYSVNTVKLNKCKYDYTVFLRILLEIRKI